MAHSLEGYTSTNKPHISASYILPLNITFLCFNFNDPVIFPRVLYDIVLLGPAITSEVRNSLLRVKPSLLMAVLTWRLWLKVICIEGTSVC